MPGGNLSRDSGILWAAGCSDSGHVRWKANTGGRTESCPWGKIVGIFLGPQISPGEGLMTSTDFTDFTDGKELHAKTRRREEGGRERKWCVFPAPLRGFTGTAAGGVWSGVRRSHNRDAVGSGFGMGPRVVLVPRTNPSRGQNAVGVGVVWCSTTIVPAVGKANGRSTKESGRSGFCRPAGAGVP